MNDAVKSTNAEKHYLNWNDIEIMIDRIIPKIDVTKYDGIYGLPRGGLIPAVIISHKTKIPYTNNITSKTLVIDDIIDSGNTLKKYSNDKITLISRHPQEINVIATGHIEYSNKWFVFPWE
jgi:hypothetical protein